MLQEGIDYYFNGDGLMVFTSEYHLKRGTCCKNECKHCPWSYKKRNRLTTSSLSIKTSSKTIINGIREGDTVEIRE
ncbi:DUF5522 domain-containing protein [Pedobacter sp. SYSU D00535]|uniref:DUF5522 domain-containing protein n=1 Tax=Pedobacter sp. SYSU D00535 TaxID=2810308 RepID=UPI001A9749D1|nr:DUF5522 domain-containing protein [Pedobacter sp. SYSU D00535]